MPYWRCAFSAVISPEVADEMVGCDSCTYVHMRWANGRLYARLCLDKDTEMLPSRVNARSDIGPPRVLPLDYGSMLAAGKVGESTMPERLCNLVLGVRGTVPGVRMLFGPDLAGCPHHLVGMACSFGVNCIVLSVVVDLHCPCALQNMEPKAPVSLVKSTKECIANARRAMVGAEALIA